MQIFIFFMDFDRSQSIGNFWIYKKANNFVIVVIYFSLDMLNLSRYGLKNIMSRERICVF